MDVCIVGAGAIGSFKSIDPDGRIEAAIPGRHVVGCVVHATCSVVEPGGSAPPDSR